MKLILYQLVLFTVVNSLDNGLVKRPPMGWLSWATFFCDVDCKNNPETCISENLYKTMADQLISGGYRDAGYEYINIDDCWAMKQRDSTGRLQADPDRFPGGIKNLANYMHESGLKFGIYSDIGTKTCERYPGSEGYFQTDADTLVEWDVDSFKLDACFIDPHTLKIRYPQMTAALNRTGKPIMFSCEWPEYEEYQNLPSNYTEVAHYCNTFRVYKDVFANWTDSIRGIIDFFEKRQDVLIPASGPGHFVDPDMIVVGHKNLTVDQAKTQFGLWSMWSAPLLMSNDLRTIAPEFKAILLNREVIAVDQDPMGVMARMVTSEGDVRIYAKPIRPIGKWGLYSFALAFVNLNIRMKAKVTVKLQKLGLTSDSGYYLRDLFEYKDLGFMKVEDTFSCVVNATGIIMIKATIGDK